MCQLIMQSRTEDVDKRMRKVRKLQYDSCQLPDMQKQVTGFDGGKDGACYTLLDSTSKGETKPVVKQS